MRAYPLNVPITVGVVLALARIASAAPIDLPTDEYMCYQAGASKVPVQAKFAGAEISSKDQFEALAFRNLRASKIAGHCNPVTNPARSDAKKAMACATSSGWPSRRIGMARIRPCCSRSGCARNRGVSVGPGQTALAVMPWRAPSLATDLVKAMSDL